MITKNHATAYASLFKKAEEVLTKYSTEFANQSIGNIDDYFDNDDYVFLLGFNKENIPILYKNNDYFSDKEKILLGYATSNELNINKKLI